LRELNQEVSRSNRSIDSRRPRWDSSLPSIGRAKA
jgi:hypothetical protein